MAHQHHTLMRFRFFPCGDDNVGQQDTFVRFRFGRYGDNCCHVCGQTSGRRCTVCQARFCHACFALLAVSSTRQLSPHSDTGYCLGACMRVKAGQLATRRKQRSLSLSLQSTLDRWECIFAQVVWPSYLARDVLKIVIDFYLWD